MNKKELKLEIMEAEKEICEYFSLEKKNSSISNKYELNTKFGLYQFYFDIDSIFGRFMDVEYLRNNIDFKEFQKCNGTMYRVIHYPNLFSGKFNFHFEEVCDFLDTLARYSDI